MELLDQYYALQTQIFAYFGYRDGWQVPPLVDARPCAWALRQAPDGAGIVAFAESTEELRDEGGSYYEWGINQKRYGPSAVYRSTDYTLMIVVPDTGRDRLLTIFTNALERKEYTLPREEREESKEGEE